MICEARAFVMLGRLLSSRRGGWHLSQHGLAIERLLEGNAGQPIANPDDGRANCDLVAPEHQIRTALEPERPFNQRTMFG